MAETRKDVILSFISWVLLLILAIGGLGVIARDDAYQLPGDGFEYLMMPVSIVNHGSTDVTQQDIDDAKAYYGNNIFDTIYLKTTKTPDGDEQTICCARNIILSPRTDKNKKKES